MHRAQQAPASPDVEPLQEAVFYQQPLQVGVHVSNALQRFRHWLSQRVVDVGRHLVREEPWNVTRAEPVQALQRVLERDALEQRRGKAYVLPEHLGARGLSLDLRDGSLEHGFRALGRKRLDEGCVGARVIGINAQHEACGGKQPMGVVFGQRAALAHRVERDLLGEHLPERQLHVFDRRRSMGRFAACRRHGTKALRALSGLARGACVARADNLARLVAHRPVSRGTIPRCGCWSRTRRGRARDSRRRSRRRTRCRGAPTARRPARG